MIQLQDVLQDPAGLPPAIFLLKNRSYVLAALGGEVEARAWPGEDYQAWVNVGSRYVYNEQSDERLRTEPVVRVNFGGGVFPESGLQLDLAFHFVSSYLSEAINPQDVQKLRTRTLGNALLLVGRLGYRVSLGLGENHLECGLTVRVPLGETFREVNGFPTPPDLLTDDRVTRSDYGGEPLVRILTLYARLNF